MTEVDVKNFESFLQDKFQDSTFVLDCRTKWNSLSQTHREDIKAELLNVKIKHNLKELNSSISHCQNMGGFVASRKLKQLGFDVEQNSRIKSDILLRMFSKNEIEACPEPLALWCAKEALFKSLKGQNQPSVVSALPSLDWIEVSNTPRIFQLNLSEKNIFPLIGYCWIGSTNCLCVWGDSI